MTEMKKTFSKSAGEALNGSKKTADDNDMYLQAVGSRPLVTVPRVFAESVRASSRKSLWD